MAHKSVRLDFELTTNQFVQPTHVAFEFFPIDIDLYRSPKDPFIIRGKLDPFYVLDDLDVHLAFRGSEGFAWSLVLKADGKELPDSPLSGSISARGGDRHADTHRLPS